MTDRGNVCRYTAIKREHSLLAVEVRVERGHAFKPATLLLHLLEGRRPPDRAWGDKLRKGIRTAIGQARRRRPGRRFRDKFGGRTALATASGFWSWSLA